MSPTRPNVPEDDPVDTTGDIAVELWFAVWVVVRTLEELVVEEVSDVTRVVEAG
jgi:hypothetical protein